LADKDENTDINKEESSNNSEKKLPAKRGRPKKVNNEPPKEENSDIKEKNEHVLEDNKISDEESIEYPGELDNQVSEENIQNTDVVIPDSEIQQDSAENKEKDEPIPSEEKIISEEQTLGIIPVPVEETNVFIPDEKLKRKSNYQISLVDENHLRARVLTGKLVNIDCYVKDKYSSSESTGERQTNRIFVHPAEKPQEIEIMVSVGLVPILEESKVEINEIIPVGNFEKDSNYQVSLVDENLLRVVVVTDKSVSIDCSIKDEDIHTDGSSETQANKIFIHPKDRPQEIEIIVSIGSGVVMETAGPFSKEEKTIAAASQKSKLVPNPLVANLIQKFSDTPGDDLEDASKTPEERLEEKLGPKNPWRIYKEMMQRNLMIGLAGAVLLYIISTISFYSYASKKNGNADVVEAPRLIVMQDLPENQFLQQNVEDPNKPPEEEKPASDDGTNTNKIPPIIPKKVKPPRIIGPTRQKVDTTNTSAIDKELDSLRKVHNNNITSNNNSKVDSTIKNAGNYPIPDSIMKGLKDNEVGLVGKFPPYWKQIDSREVDINKKDFTGVILVDTSVKKKEEALNMSVQIDKNNEYWKQFNFKNIFSEDSLKNIIYSIEPKQEGDQTYYRFYISGMAYNIYIASFINNEHFEKHKAEIEQVVRSIKIQKPPPPSGNK
jgi:hypothetical protein